MQNEWVKTVGRSGFSRSAGEDDQRTPSTLAWRTTELQHRRIVRLGDETPATTQTGDGKVQGDEGTTGHHVERQRRRQGQE